MLKLVLARFLKLKLMSGSKTKARSTSKAPIVMKSIVWEFLHLTLFGENEKKNLRPCHGQKKCIESDQCEKIFSFLFSSNKKFDLQRRQSLVWAGFVLLARKQKIWNWTARFSWNFIKPKLLSAAIGQRPRNYSSCCCCSYSFPFASFSL